MCRGCLPREMTQLDNLPLVSYHPDTCGLYDRHGNRYLFADHREYLCFYHQQIIRWLTQGIPPLFL